MRKFCLFLLLSLTVSAAHAWTGLEEEENNDEIEEIIYDEVQEANEQATEVNDQVQEANEEAEVVLEEHEDGNGFIDASKFVGYDYF